jgi:hypothetical protein
MNADKSSFPAAWPSIELRGYRECPSTYCDFPYESLPALPNELFRGDFQWLTESGREAPLAESDEEYLQSEFSRIRNSASEIGLKLPEPFVKFLAAGELRGRHMFSH